MDPSKALYGAPGSFGGSLDDLPLATGALSLGSGGGQAGPSSAGADQEIALNQVQEKAWKEFNIAEGFLAKAEAEFGQTLMDLEMFCVTIRSLKGVASGQVQEGRDKALRAAKQSIKKRAQDLKESLENMTRLRKIMVQNLDPLLSELDDDDDE